MSNIPLHIQRRFEQRWAARFLPVAAAPQAVPANGATSGAGLRSEGSMVSDPLSNSRTRPTIGATRGRFGSAVRS
jgi:hypothetical protein